MLLTFEETKKKILDGDYLYLAGDEKLLKSLPAGNWIGGTIPYFMDINGGIVSDELIFVTEQDKSVTKSEIKWYDENNINQVSEDSPASGFSIIIIPATSKVHIKYSKEASDYKDIFYKQIIGWISGVNLKDLEEVTPKVFHGQTGEYSDSKAIVLHAVLPETKIPKIGIINIFTQGESDTISFYQDEFSVVDCMINGKKRIFAEYLLENKIDLRLPLVADYSGAMINVSFQNIDKESNTVNFYAPVFKNVDYKFAAPVNNYVQLFESHIPSGLINPAFSCNCILNFLYSELEGKNTGQIYGPVTFGEIAYQLLNQTLVYLTIEDKI